MKRTRKRSPSSITISHTLAKPRTLIHHIERDSDNTFFLFLFLFLLLGGLQLSSTASIGGLESDEKPAADDAPGEHYTLLLLPLLFSYCFSFPLTFSLLSDIFARSLVRSLARSILLLPHIFKNTKSVFPAPAAPTPLYKIIVIY